MRTAPSFEIELRHFGVWRAAVLGLSLFAAVVLAAWGWRTPGGVGAGGIAAGATAIGAALLSLRGHSPMRLRFDGQHWFVLAGTSNHDDAAPPVQLEVVIDLGSWMLLHLHAVDHRRGACWVPAQRRGHESAWHAMRCAVYFPRPIGGRTGDTPHFPE